ncbi:FkbM family methyltransferase [Patescibacteria group bacterium]|nr:FkbM family methyltransferase [Desulfobacteraceae bacterium]MBU4027153.1 FkbM family methyltransferase [Patescibacteria group bacterium]MBU4069269.1 FkbM family methyltransferase [Pseudomonadota bacterium]
MKCSDILENLFLSLPLVTDHHAPGSQLYNLFKHVARKEIEGLFSDMESQSIGFQPFGELVFPYHKMGAVDSLNLFDLDELIIFSFYWKNRTRYRKVLDIGANLGLHSILLRKCGYEVSCYEPDPRHFEILKDNLALNHISDVEAFNKAVSTQKGEGEFVRVLGNTTGSHLVGAKSNPYGELKRFSVQMEGFHEIITDVDLIKMDIEGHEKEVLLNTAYEDWKNMDVLVEIENADNAAAIYEHFTRLGIRLFAQKKNWLEVHTVDEMPTSYREGTLFVSMKSEMPW